MQPVKTDDDAKRRLHAVRAKIQRIQKALDAAKDVELQILAGLTGLNPVRVLTPPARPRRGKPTKSPRRSTQV